GAARAEAKAAPRPVRARPGTRPRLRAVARARLAVDAVVMAAGLGTRLRPLTERWPKPVLPIDGRPVIAVLLRELAAAGIGRATVVTGHLAEQVEALVGDGSAFGLDVRRALGAGAAPPFLISAADTLFSPGDVAAFTAAFAASGAAGALAARTRPA